MTLIRTASADGGGDPPAPHYYAATPAGCTEGRIDDCDSVYLYAVQPCAAPGTTGTPGVNETFPLVVYLCFNCVHLR